MSELASAWQSVVIAEQAAMRGYGTLGPHLLASSSVTLARECEQIHRDRTAQAVTGAAAAGNQASPDAADYQPPFPVQDEQSAQRLAVRLEESAATAWRYLFAVIASDTVDSAATSSRTASLAALTGSAVHAVQWRRLVTPAQPSVPFPGI